MLRLKLGGLLFPLALDVAVQRLYKMHDAVLKTLSYFAIFNFPLTRDEIWNYLIELTGVTQVEFEKTLDEFTSTGLVKMVGDNYYTLSQIEPVDRKQRGEVSQQKIDQAQRIFAGLKWWPYLKAVLVTGSVAALNAVESSDIDVLIVTSKDTLWLTRLIVVLYLKVKGVYRKIICPNIWLAEDSLEWPSHDLHSAFDAVLAKPIFSRDNTCEKFLGENSWVQKLIPNAPINPSFVGVTQASPSTRVGHAPPLQGLIRVTNLVLFQLEKWFMRGKQTTEEISYNRIHFKKNDNKKRILEEYSKILGQCGGAT